MSADTDTRAPRRPLSLTEDRVLCALCLYTHRHRRQPSQRELAAVVGVSTVRVYLLSIEAKGWISGAAGKARAIEIPDDVFESIIETGEVPAAPAKKEE